ncbi:unnamed protein product [Caenorhabditis brenneri]
MGSLFSVIAAYKELFPSYSGPIDPDILARCSPHVRELVSDPKRFSRAVNGAFVTIAANKHDTVQLMEIIKGSHPIFQRLN